MHATLRGAFGGLCALVVLAFLAASICAPASAGAGVAVRGMVPSTESEEAAKPPPGADDPLEGEAAPPSAREDEEEDQAGEGCPYLERPLELIV